jgi:hypothetical protein
MALRASPDRFVAAVKKAFKDDPTGVRLVRITDDEAEECDQEEVKRRPGRFELRRAKTDESVLWTDSSVDDHSGSSGSDKEKALARDLERSGMSWGLSVSMAQTDNERLYKRTEALEARLDAANKEILRLSEKIAEQIAGETGEEEWVHLAEAIAMKLIDRQFTRELHRRLNQCKASMTKAEAERWAQIINSPEFNRDEAEAPAAEPRRLDA